MAAMLYQPLRGILFAGGRARFISIEWYELSCHRVTCPRCELDFPRHGLHGVTSDYPDPCTGQMWIEHQPGCLWLPEVRFDERLVRSNGDVGAHFTTVVEPGALDWSVAQWVLGPMPYEPLPGPNQRSLHRCCHPNYGTSPLRDYFGFWHAREKLKRAQQVEEATIEDLKLVLGSLHDEHAQAVFDAEGNFRYVPSKNFPKKA